MAKFFRVATEGATTDGREIQREWIEQMAANYDQNKYGARIWMEHIRGISADSAFGALGDVLSVEAREVEDGKLALFAEIEPTEQLKEINKRRQKVYTSIEVNPKFADTGEAYLEGLAVTDSPASLGTEFLKFSREAGDKSPLAGRKQHADNLFTASEEVNFDFGEEETPKPGIGEFVKKLFSRQEAKTNKGFEAFGADIKVAFEEFAQRHDAMNAELENRPTAEAFNQLQSDHDALKKSFDELYAALDKEPDTPRRAAATGGGTVEETDC